MAHAHEASGDLFRLAFELSPTGLLAVDVDGRILLANREIERLFGHAMDALVGERVEMLVPERFRGRHPIFRGEYFREPQSRPMGAGRDLFGLHKDGTEVPVEIGLNPIAGPGGTVILASVVDISERRRLEDRARHSQKMEAIGTLAGGIAHDFNNILLSIVGHTELARRAASHDAQQQQDLDKVLTAAERGRQLVQRILTFSRQRDVSRTPLRLERPVREALHLLRATLPAGIEMRDTLDPSTPEVLADDTQMHQIVMNLATNAAHAMAEGGALDVRVSPVEVDAAFASRRAGLRPGRWARITVKDTGAGMTPDVLRRALEPFFTTKPPGQGTGLGLSVIHGIVESHGGAIEIQSEPGKGTRVDVYLPSALAAEPNAAAPEAAGQGGASARILLVDDEETLLQMMTRQLQLMGHRVTPFLSSTDALEDFRMRPDAFDLVISDNSMPRLSGLDLAERIRALRDDLPILLISGLAQTVEADLIREHGVTKVLPKPHTGAELERALEELLRSNRA